MGKEMQLDDSGPGFGTQLLSLGRQAQLLLSLQRDSFVPASLEPSRRRLRAAGFREAAEPKAAEGRSTASSSTTQPAVAEKVDLVVSWRSVLDAQRWGEVCIWQVPCDRPGPLPSPLDLHLLAPATATLAHDTSSLMLPVTLQVRNTSALGPVTFYFVADSTPDFTWLCCEHSAAISLPRLGTHVSTLHVYFTSPGVFNLNRIRLFVTSMPPAATAVPASEQRLHWPLRFLSRDSFT